ncbi:hypothetical protein [Bradyrhizobium cenepequi]
MLLRPEKTWKRAHPPCRDRLAADMTQAVEWYRRAAQGGHYPSQARLGYCYAKGLGVAADPVEVRLAQRSDAALPSGARGEGGHP